MKTICILVVLFTSIGFTQTTNRVKGNNPTINENNDYPKHSVDVGISYWNNSKSGTSFRVPGIDIRAGAVTGKLMYNFYPDDKIAFNVSIGAMAVEVKFSTFQEYTSIVVPLMMGTKYYFVQSAQGDSFRPYISGSMGILFGIESSIKELSIKEHTESSIGTHAGIGCDFILGSLIKLQTNIGYNLFADFSKEIGNRKNYSGVEYSFGIGFLF